MRTSAWVTILGLAGLAVACGDQPTEVVPDRKPKAGMTGGGTVALATASSGDGFSITTDKDDYQPGDVVHLTGAGWDPEDVIDIVLTDQPQTHPPPQWTVTVEADGTFTDDTYTVDEGDLDVTFTLVATSRNSGQSLSMTFTDGNLQDVALTPTSVSVPQTGSVSSTINVTINGNASNCTVTLSVLASPALPTGVTTSIANNTVTTNASFSRTLNFTTSGVAAGSYPFTVQAARGGNCQGNGNLTASGSLVVMGAASHLAFSQQPSNTGSNSSITPAVAVSVLDDGNNVVPTSSASITLAIETNAGGGTLSGTVTRAAVNGVATFPGLTLDKVGAGYTLMASSNGLAGVISNPFSITPGTATKLAFSVQPSGAAPTTAFTAQPVVQVQDAAGNVKTSGTGNNASVTLTIVSGTGTAGATLTCTPNSSRAAVAGVAAFSGCRINLAGTGYRLHAASAGLTSADSDPINVVANNQAPSVNAGVYTVAEGTGVTLAPSVTDPDAGDALTYKWTVNTAGIDAGGSGTFDNNLQKNATVTCTDDSDDAINDAFTLMLEVNDGHGHIVSDDADLKVTNVAPVADAKGPYTGNEGQAIVLDGSANDAGDNDDPHLTYLWTVSTVGIDAGGSCSFDDATKKDAKVTCTDDSNAGTFALTLLASDDDGGTSVATGTTLKVNNLPPVANAGTDYSGDEGAAIPLGGSGNDPGDNDDPHLTYHWTVSTPGIDPGGACSFDNADDKNAKVTCTDDGAFQVTLVVKDDDAGTSSGSTVKLDVGNAGPMANAGPDYTGVEGSPVQLNGSVTDAGSNDTHVWSWKYLAGAGLDAGATCSFSSATAEDPTVTCTDDGVVELTLTVTDDDGAASSDKATLTLTNVDPVANAGPDYTGKEGSAVQLNGSLTDAGSNDTHTWYWKYVAGAGVDAGATCIFSSTSAEDPTITCTDDGVVELTLKITDDDGGTGSDTALLTLANVAPTADAGGAYAGTEGGTVSLTGMVDDAGDNDQLTSQWSYTAGAGVDAGATCSFTPTASALSPSVSCTDDGVYQLTLTVHDDDGAQGTDQTTLTLANADPVADAGPDYTGDEGSPIQLSGSVTDAGSNDTHTWYWKYVAGAGVDAGATCNFSSATAEDPTITCTDDGVIELTLKVTDDDGGIGTDKAMLTLKNVAPSADAGGPYSGTEGDAVSLTGVAHDAGTNDQLTTHWSYTAVSGVDPGATCSFTPNASALSPSVSCTDDGAYQVTLTLTDDDGAESSDHTTLTLANADPVANAGPGYNGKEGSPIQLNGSVTDAGSNDNHTWYWKYVAGAGVDAGATCSFSSATAEDPTITCTDDGVVELTLKATDDDGAASSDKATLTLTNVDPVANAGPDYTGKEGSAVQLNGSLTDAGSNDTHTWYWKYVAGAGVDAGATCIFSSTSAEDPTITCTDDGVVELTLKITDDDGGTGSDTALLTLANVAPTADAGGAYAGTEGGTVSLTGMVDDAGDNDQLTSQWSYTAGAGVDAGATCSFTPTASALSPSVSCTDDGVYQLTLTVHDDDGAQGTDQTTLTLANADPVADAGPDYTGDEGSPIQLSGSVTDAGSNDTHTWYWKYLAGAGVDAEATCNFSSATAEDPTITCTDDGVIELTLKVTDDDGGIGTDKAMLTLKNVAPSADAGGPYSGTEGDAVSLTGVAHDAGTNDQLTTHWSYTAVSGVDPGATCSFTPNASALSPSVSCTDDGAYQVTLTVTDDDGAESSDHTTLTLANADPVANAGPDYNGKEGSPIQLNGSVTDAGSNDNHTWYWKYVAGAGVDAGATCSFSSATAEDPTITCTDDGVVELTLKATDDDGAASSDKATLTLTNVDPVANAGPDYTGKEGSAVQLNGSLTDAGSNDTHTWYWKYVAGAGVDAGATCIFSSTSAEDPTITCTDDGVVELTLKITDDDGGTG